MKSELAAQEQEARQVILPSFLLAGALRRTGPNTILRRMQDLKGREFELVRWRSGPPIADRMVQLVLTAMRAHARTGLRGTDNAFDLLQLSEPPGSASVVPAVFVEKVHRQSLWATRLKKEDEGVLRQAYRVLLEDFPVTTVQKVGGEQLSTDEGRGQAIAQLSSKFGGEIVELDDKRMGWVLRPTDSGAARVKWTQQWQCKEDATCVGLIASKADPQYGYSGQNDVRVKMSEEMKRVMKEIGGAVSYGFLCPDWAAQRFRTVVPCKGTVDYEWRRTGQAVNLGILFSVLGTKYPAKAIYSFYLSLRILCTKRLKNSANATTMDPCYGPASRMPSHVAGGGTTGTMLQASRQQSS